jgi:hypothetical protein
LGGKEPLMLVGYKLVQPLWKAIWRFLEKLKTEIPYGPVIPLQKNVSQDSIETLAHPCLLQHKLWKQPRCLTSNEWIEKMWYLYTVEYYSGKKMNEIMLLVNGWNWRSHVKWSKPGLEGQRLHVYSYMWKLDLKDKCIHKYICDLIYIYTCIYIYIYIYIYI